MIVFAISVSAINCPLDHPDRAARNSRHSESASQCRWACVWAAIRSLQVHGCPNSWVPTRWPQLEDAPYSCLCPLPQARCSHTFGASLFNQSTWRPCTPGSRAHKTGLGSHLSSSVHHETPPPLRSRVHPQTPTMGRRHCKCCNDRPDPHPGAAPRPRSHRLPMPVAPSSGQLLLSRPAPAAFGKDPTYLQFRLLSPGLSPAVAPTAMPNNK